MTGEPISIRSLADETGVVLRDQIADVRYEIHTDRPVDPRTVTTDEFEMGLDVAFSVEASRLHFPEGVGCAVREPDGTLLEIMQYGANRRVTGPVLLDAQGSSMTLYVRITGSATVSYGDRLRVTTGQQTEFTFGARSYHEHPAGTVQTTDDPRDVMAAVSTFGSALKATGPRRSYPTLRGHPPLIERGSTFSVPDTVSTPVSDVVVEVPPDFASVYRVAPLAYYLTATVEPGPEPRIVAGSSSIPLSVPPLDTEQRIDRFLRKTFFLDCVVRSEGGFPSTLRERRAVEASLPFDPASVYDCSSAERLVAYDEVAFETVEPHLPVWPLRSNVEPRIERVGYLPFAAMRLSTIRIVEQSTAPLHPEPASLTAFARARGPDSASSSPDPATTHFDLPESGAMTHAWLGPGCPGGAVTPDIPAMQRRAVRRTDSAGRITVEVVCTDREMSAEARGELYGLRELVDVDVTVHHDCSCAELAGLLRRDVDLFHYIGHVDDDGFRCADGTLDARTLDSTGVDAFLLNACRSYEQGQALVDAGAWGGIVTVSKVFNDHATTVGRHVARLLNAGFTLDATLSVLDYGSVQTHRYAVVGAHRHRLCQPENGPNGLCLLDTAGDDYELSYVWLPTDDIDVGCEAYHSPADDESALGTGRMGTWSVPASEIEDGLTSPLVFDGEIHWTDELPDGA